MKKENGINEKIGETVGLIRQAKHLKLREVTKGQFSESQLSKFENGETDITVSKFFDVLENSNTYLDEFQQIYNEYVSNEEEILQKKLAELYAKKDIKGIKEILDFWETKIQENPEHKFYKLNKTVLKIILAMAQNSKPFEEDIDFLMTYLDSVSDWGRYEIWIFGNCLRFFDNNALKNYGLLILGKTEFYSSIHLNQQMVIRTFLNLIDTFLRHGNLVLALKYINHLDKMTIKIDFFYEKIILNYHKAHYRTLQNQKSGIEEMKKCASTLEQYGYREEAQALYQEIENL
ncbi:transcriptional regulator [Lactococcus nasutitermitis]|uniref:Transcriptional regulator n=1 Tax=Lactococcus nasutitermitis TaxID=1652957 RepID=A0ABV9JFF6_9LACT|nr:Rgg/GadR/MutR family transcriptional regulator [Lactococcus nasutitermitis]